MVDGFSDLDTVEPTVGLDPSILAQKIAYDKIYLDCFNTPEGERMFNALRERLVDVTIYKRGSTLEETAYTQGMADVVKMMDACVYDAVNPPVNNN